MPDLTSVSRRELIQRLRRLGFDITRKVEDPVLKKLQVVGAGEDQGMIVSGG